MRLVAGVFLALSLLAGFGEARAQRVTLMAPLPQGIATSQILDTTQQVLSARGWSVSPGDATSIFAEKSGAGMRVFVENEKGALTYFDLSRRAATKGVPLLAVPRNAIEELRADLAAAFAGATPGAPVAVKPASQVLVAVPPAADPARVIDAARTALAGRHWTVKNEDDGALLATIHSGDADTRLKIFLADGALRFIDQSTRRDGAEKTQAPERWIGYLRSDIGGALKALPAQAQTSGAPSAGDPVERLRKLKAMLDSGLITPDEYDSKRKEILRGL